MICRSTGVVETTTIVDYNFVPLDGPVDSVAVSENCLGNAHSGCPAVAKCNAYRFVLPRPCVRAVGIVGASLSSGLGGGGTTAYKLMIKARYTAEQREMD